MNNPAKVILKAGMDGTPEWQALRHTGIGGTDIAQALTGRKTYHDIIGQKLGTVPPEEYSAKTLELFAYGHEREPFLRQKAVELFGVKFRGTGTHQSRFEPGFLANPDGITGDSILEIKTTGGFTEAAKDWRKGRVPAHAWFQAHWYSFVTGKKKLYFIAEVDREVIALGPYEADPEVLEKVEQTGRELLGYLERKETPPLEPSTALARSYRSAEGAEELVIEPWDDTLAVIEKLRTVKAEQKRLAEEQKALEEHIKTAMGEAKVLKDHEGEPLATWDYSTRRTLDKKKLTSAGIVLADFETATEIRTFRLKESAK